MIQFLIRMIQKIKKLIYGKETVSIQQVTMKDGEIIFYFKVLHPFLTRKEVNRLGHKLHEFFKEDNRLLTKIVFEEEPSLLERFFKSKIK